MKLRNENLTLQDFILERELFEYILKEQLEEYHKNPNSYTVVKVRLFNTEAYAVYESNGVCYFEDGDNIDKYKLDEPSFFEGITVFGNTNDYDEADLSFSDDKNALEWEADFNGEAISYEFRLQRNSCDGFAGFIGFFTVRE